MYGRHVRHSIMILSLSMLTASDAQACHWWKSCFGPAPATTFYAPYTASYAPTGCGQTVSYMPQTAYRTVYVNAPVMGYQPVTSANPCTGCATTVMRPVVSYVTQAQLVPYTTYRPVVTQAATPCCGAAPVMTSYAPAAPAVPAIMAPAPAPAPCCGAAAAAPATYAAPATVMTGAPVGTPGAAVPSLAPMPGYPTPAPALTQQPAMAAPSLYPPPVATPPAVVAPPANTAPQSIFGQDNRLPAGALPPTSNPNPPVDTAPQNRTFENPNGTKPNQPESRLLLPPRTEPANSDSNRALRGLDPEQNQDRFTAIPLRQPSPFRPASLVTPIPADGRDATWQASRR
ncbi:MAG TPA: hypothetical protein VGJ16_02525 [Pirellulales bacterium]